MPNRLELPTELEALIEKRELEHRRQADRERAAQEEQQQGVDCNSADQDTALAPPVVVPVERRKTPDRRQDPQD